MKLNERRKEIDQIDQQITKLLNERFIIVKEIKEIKNKENIKTLDEQREQEVINNNKKFIEIEFHEQFIQIYKTIMDASKDFQDT